MTLVHGFELFREQKIPELNIRARLFHHIQTGAELLSLENDDENKVFGITFRTPPPDSTGIPHIMEHVLLCGSRKYPLKEPFVELVKGSLNTFLNAWTYPDKTCYPVASQNLQDFYNLIEVYLDAVFYPLLTPHIFQQEGWHYELEDLDAPLTFKGVVFNEMKGLYSSPENLLEEFSRQSLFPDNNYGFDSGGNPLEIPSLTYERLKAFHQTHYHPSNARIFFYGDDHSDQRLGLVNEYLQNFERITVKSAVSLQPRFDQPRRLICSFDANQEGDADKKGMLTVNWLLTKNVEPETTLGLRILTHILIGTPASPLRKTLIESGLGEALTSGGLDSDLFQMTFSTGLKGIAVGDATKVEFLILETLAHLVRDGIDSGMVEAGVNSFEFHLRENNTGRYPRGLHFMLRALNTWLYGGDPWAALTFEAPLMAIKARLAAGEPYFESLVNRYLIGNPHRTIVLFKPDPELRQRHGAAEAEALTRARARMSQGELEAIVENTRQLKRLQETPDPPQVLATIPALTLNDLDKQCKPIPLEVLEEKGSKILYHDLFTNGIVYLEVGFDLRALPQELLPYVPLFGQALVKMGTEKEDYVKLSQRVGRKMGGLSHGTFTSASRISPEGATWFLLRGKATVARADDMLAIIQDVLLKIRLDDQERFKQLVLEAKAKKEMSIVPEGHRMVYMRLRAHFSPATWAAEQMGGISYLFFLRQLAQEVEENWPAVLEKLEAVRRKLVNRNNMLCNVTLDAANWSSFRFKLSGFITDLPEAPASLAQWAPRHSPSFEGLIIPAQVNYVGKATNLYDSGYRLHGSVDVIGNYLWTTWLWERVRVQGGAYGGFFLFDHHSGVLVFLSYRDPNLLSTLDTFDQTGQFLRQLDLHEDELTRCIIGAIGKMDAYQLPDAKGYTSLFRWLTGETDELCQRHRDEILATTVADLRAFAKVLERANHKGLVAVMGSQEAIGAVNAGRGGWLKVQKVL